MVGQKRPRRALIVGLDSATLGFFDRFSREGRLPAIGGLMAKGTVAEAYSSPPAATATNWNTIATGAHAGTHGVTGMVILGKDDDLDGGQTGFSSTHRQAETLWEAAERAGKAPILLKYTGSWPPTVKNGIQVEGVGDPGWNPLAVAPRLCFANHRLHNPRPLLTRPPAGTIPQAIEFQLRAADGWANAPQGGRQPLAATLAYTPPGGRRPTVLHALVIAREGGGYDRVLIADRQDAEAALCELAPGQWGTWIKATFHTAAGAKEGLFRFKLLQLAADGSSLRLITSQIFPTDGWTVPDSLAKELTERVGPYQELTSVNAPYVSGWVDEQHLVEETEYQARWLAGAAKHLLSGYPWDLALTQFHAIDHMGHLFLGGMDPHCIFYRPEREALCTEMIAQGYQWSDYFVGQLLEQVDDDTLLVVTSDHGSTTLRAPGLNANEVLAQHGLVQYVDNPLRHAYPFVVPPSSEVDWSRTVAYEAQESFIYVNLKGRQPHGIVEPGQQYESVCKQIVNILQSVRDAETGDPVVAMALRKEEARHLGLHGERVGDVVYFLKPELSRPLAKRSPQMPSGGFGFTANHHGYLHSAKFADRPEFTQVAVTLFAGPGIKKGWRRPLPIRLVDIAPTVAYLAGIPIPRHAEGAVLWDILAD